MIDKDRLQRYSERPWEATTSGVEALVDTIRELKAEVERLRAFSNPIVKCASCDHRREAHEGGHACAMLDGCLEFKEPEEERTR